MKKILLQLLIWVVESEPCCLTTCRCAFCSLHDIRHLAQMSSVHAVLRRRFLRPSSRRGSFWGIICQAVLLVNFNHFNPEKFWIHCWLRFDYILFWMVIVHRVALISQIFLLLEKKCHIKILLYTQIWGEVRSRVWFCHMTLVVA